MLLDVQALPTSRQPGPSTPIFCNLLTRPNTVLPRRAHRLKVRLSRDERGRQLRLDRREVVQHFLAAAKVGVAAAVPRVQRVVSNVVDHLVGLRSKVAVKGAHTDRPPIS